MSINEWISVEDKLPENAEPVLTCDIDFYPDSVTCDTYLPPLKIWSNAEDGDITHWRPMPPGPYHEIKG